MQFNLKICQYGDRIVVSCFDYGVVALGVVCFDIFCQHYPLAADTFTLAPACQAQPGHTLGKLCTDGDDPHLGFDCHTKNHSALPLAEKKKKDEM